MLIGSFAFANTLSVERQNDINIENCTNHLKVLVDLGDLSNLNETELYNLLDNLPIQVLDSEQFSECTISYSFTFSFMGQSVTVTASGTAETCAEAGNIARDGIKNEVAKAKEMIMNLN